ncbi:hypothetical protein RIF29_21393 [Crotalaria pallida]|uniref:RNase H type-1 domain-containing protein n=1 Tax=Crotalaria pallida TaxID=3830 RepID=A0AAN9I760_CROPI
MVHQSDKLWVRMIRAKYCPLALGDFLFGENKNGSFLSNSICKARDSLKDGFVFRVGNGASSIWYDSWLHVGPLWKMVPFIQIHDTDLRIRDLVAGQQWSLDDIRTDIPQQAKDCILHGRVPKLNASLHDVWVWDINPVGIYTVRSGYDWLKERSEASPINPPHANWSWIWKLKIPENIKLLVWLIAHDSVLTNGLRARRGLTTNGTCSRCCREEETVMHCFRDCGEARNIWHLSGLWSCCSDFASITDPVLWIRMGNSQNSALFFASLWWIWRAKNAMCIDHLKIPIPTVMNSINNLYSLIKNELNPVPAASSPQRWVKWENPPAGFIAVNVDGSCFDNPGPAGFGGLLRDDLGKWLLGFSGHIGISYNLHAEIEAIRNRLEVAWNYGARRVICYSDSLEALRLVGKDPGVYHRMA